MTTQKVEESDLPVRLDHFLTRRFEQVPSRAWARKAIKRGEVALNGEHAEGSRWLRPGDVVVLQASRRRAPVLELEIRVLYEDEHIGVVDKPSGIETSGAKCRVLEHALPFNLEPSERADALAQPRVVHRLDYPTSGLVLCAKTGSAHAALGRSFQARTILKRYRAILTGRLEGEGRVEVSLEGREAHSRYAAREHTPSLHIGWQTTVDLWPKTGRTHQLRRHMASLGHPILGDALYGEGKVLRGRGLFLCAVELVFPHPVSGDSLRIVRDEPQRFRTFREREARRFRHWKERGSSEPPA